MFYYTKGVGVDFEKQGLNLKWGICSNKWVSTWVPANILVLKSRTPSSSSKRNYFMIYGILLCEHPLAVVYLFIPQKTV